MKKCLQGLLVDATTLLFSALKVINRVRDETSSGGLLANDCLVHYSVSSLPFGGVGEYFHRQDSAFLLSLNGDVTISALKLGRACGTPCVHVHAALMTVSKKCAGVCRKQRDGLLPRQVQL